MSGVIIFCFIMIFAAKQTIDKNSTFKRTSTDSISTTEVTETTTEYSEDIVEDVTTEHSSEAETATIATTVVSTTATSTTKPRQETQIQISTPPKKTSTDATAVEYYLSDDERRVVECIVMGEAGGEPYEGQILVAQCILNACKKDGLKPSQVRREYKYSGWNSNPSKSVKNAVSAVFDDGYKATNEYILYFYAPKYAKGRWHETQKFVCEVGGHRFFAEW